MLLMRFQNIYQLKLNFIDMFVLRNLNKSLNIDLYEEQKQ